MVKMQNKNDNNNLTAVDELIQKVKDIEIELDKVFDIVCDESEISVYKSYLLNAKLGALQILLKETIDELKSERKRLFRLGFKLHTLELLFDVTTILISFINGPIGLTVLGINILCSIKMYKMHNKSVDDTKSCDDAIEGTKKLDIVFENCYRLLKGHTNHELENKPEVLSNEELRCIDLANEHIEIAMVSGVVDNIPEEVRSTMIMMLQDDLQTDESDLVKLLEMATKRIESESLVQEGEMRLSRGKKNDFVEK